MSRNYFLSRTNFYCLFKPILTSLLVLAFAAGVNAQHIFATGQSNGSTGICLGCSVSSPTNAHDSNLQSYSTLNVTVGIAATTYQTLIFPAAVAPNTPVTIKLGSGNNLLSLTALGAVSIQAYNGGSTAGGSITASTLISALSSNDQYELTITPGVAYDRVRVTLNGGAVGALANLYLYEAFYNQSGSVACNNAFDELHGISAGLVGLGAGIGGVVNPQNAFDGNLTTAATLNAGVGLLGAYAQETVIFQAPSQLGDSVKLTLGIPQSLINAGLLSNVSVSTLNGNTSNGDSHFLNSPLLNVQLLGTQIIGSTLTRQVVVSYAPTSIFDRVQLKLGGIASVLSTLNFYEAQKIVPNPVVFINGVQANSTTICAGSSTTLSLTASANTQYNWYTQAAGGIPVFTGNTFVTPALNATTTYYVAANHTGCTDQSARTALVINVNPIPGAPVVPNSTIGVCSGTPATFTANNVAGVSFNWYSQPTGGTPIFTGSSFTTSPLTTTTSYYVEAANGSCTSSSRTMVTATINALPSAPALTAANATICSGNTAALSIASPAGGYTYNWYTTAAGGAPVFTGVNFTTPALTTNTTYYAEAVNSSGCVSAGRTTATVTVLPQPSVPTLSADKQTVTTGQSATITVTNAQSGIVYNWYTSNISSTPIFTGTAYQTPPLSTGTTYYVEAANSIGCLSASRAQITITVAPDVAVNPATQNINAGSTATFTASSTTPGAVFNWYTSPTGGTPVYTGATFTTPPSFSNTTWYVDATDPATGVTSISRVPAAVIINSTPSNPVPCDAATTQVNSTSGILCIGCAIYNPGGSVDNNSNTFSQLDVPIGIAGGYAQQTLQFASPAITGDSVVLMLGIPGTLASVNVLSQISIATYSGATFNNDRFALNGSLINVNVLSGTSIFRVAFKATSAFDRVEVRLNSGLAGVFNALNIYYAAQEVPAPIISTPNISICQGLPVTLTATVLSNVTVNWYTQASGGAPVFTGNPFTTPSLNSSITYYAEATGADGCAQTVRTSATVTVQPTPASPVVTTNSVTLCAGNQATFAANSVAGVTFNWYTQASGGAPVFSGNPFVTPALNTSTVYYVEAVNASCSSTARTQVTATVNPSPAAPVVPVNNVSICSGNTATFTANNVSGVTYNWYTNSTGGSPVFTGNPFTTPILNTTTSYYVEAVNGSCTSPSRTQVTATVTQTPAVPVLAQTPVQICSGSSAVLTVNTVPAGTTINWYSSSSGGTLLFTGAQFTTPPLTSNTSYYAEASSGFCVSTSRAQADVIVNPVPATPTFAVSPLSAQITSGQTAAITASDSSPGTSFNWYTTATGGTSIFSGTTFTTPALTSTTSYYIEGVSGTGCTSAQRAQVVITVNPVFSTSCDFATSQTNTANGLCIGCSVSNPNNAADADTTTFSTLNMTVAVLGASVNQTVIFGDTGSAGDTVTIKVGVPGTTFSAGVLSAIQIQSYNGATVNSDLTNLSGSTVSIRLLSGGNIALIKFVPNATFDRVQLTVNSGIAAALNSFNIYYATKQVPVPSLSATAVNICSGSTATFTLNNPFADVTYNWYTSAVGGISVHSGTSFTSPALSTTTTYYIESSRTSNGCANPNRVAVTVNVTPSPVVPVLAQSTVNICSGDNALLTVTNAGGATVNWYDAPANGNLLFTGAVLSVSPSANTSYYAELANGTCVSANRTQATVVVNARPVAFTLQNSNLLICPGSTATLQINSPEAGVAYNWYTVASGGVAVFTGNTFTTPALSANTVYYAEAVNSTTGCGNTGGRVSATITISSPVAAPVLNSSAIQVCSGNAVTVLVNNPQAGYTYNWYTAPSGGVAVSSGTSLILTNLTGNISYYAEAVNGIGCVSGSRTQVNIQVNPLPVAAQITDQTGSSTPSVCSGNTTQLTATSTTPGVTFNWYDATTGGTLLFTGSAFNTPVLTANATYYVEVISASTGCASAARTPVTVTVNPQPSAPVLANGSTVNSCSGSAVTLNINNPQPGYTYNWYTASSGGAAVSLGTTFVLSNVTSNISYYAAAVNSTGCISGSRTQVDIQVNPLPVAPQVKDQAGSSAPAICSGDIAQLTATSITPGVIFNWYDAATGGTLLFTGSTLNTPALTGNTTYYVEATNASTGCVSAARTPVTVTVNPQPSAPAVANGNSLSICSGSAITLNINNPQTGYIYRWYTASSGGVALFSGTSFVLTNVTGNVSYYTEAVNGTGCISGSRTQVDIQVNPLPAAPQVTDQSGSSAPSVCSGNIAQLKASSTTPGVAFNWYSAATGGTLLFTGSAFSTPVLTANATYYVEAANASTGCISAARTPVTVIVNPQPSAPVVANGNSVSVCSGSAVTLNISNAQPGYTYNWYTASSGSIALFSGQSFTANPGANISYYAEAVNSTGCISGSRTQVNIQVNPLPAAPQVTDQSGSATPSVCSGGVAQLKATSTTPGVTFNWYDAATGGTLIYTGSTFNTPSLTANTTYFVQAVNSSGCTSTVRSPVTVKTITAPAKPQSANSSVSICPGNSTTLSATSDPNTVINWYSVSNGGTPIFTGSTMTTPVLTTTTTYYVEAVNTTGCTSSQRAVVTVNMLQPLNAPAVTVGQITANSVSFSWQAVTGATGYEVSLDNGQNFITPSSGATGLTHMVSNLQPGQSVSIIVRAIGKTACELSANSAVVTASSDNPFGDNVYVPNAFTPNGDGKNDTFLAYSNNMQKIMLSVYNQWGELIYRTTDKSAGWDGTYKGHDQPVGVYVYYLEATMIDGHSVNKKGTVTLLR